MGVEGGGGGAGEIFEDRRRWFGVVDHLGDRQRGAHPSHEFGVADAVQVARRRVPVSVGLALPPTHVRAVNVQTGLPIIDTRPNPPVPVQVAVQPAPGAAQFAAILDIPPSAGPLVRVRQAPAGALNRRAYADDWTSETGAAGVLDLFWENAQDTVPAGPGQVYRIVVARR